MQLIPNSWDIHNWMMTMNITQGKKPIWLYLTKKKEYELDMLEEIDDIWILDLLILLCF